MALENVYNQLYMDTNYSFSHWHIFLETFYSKPGFPLFMEHQLVFLKMLTSVLSFKTEVESCEKIQTGTLMTENFG